MVFCNSCRLRQSLKVIKGINIFTFGTCVLLLHQLSKWRKTKSILPASGRWSSSRRGFIATQLQIMNVHSLNNYTLLICYLVFLLLAFLRCSTGDWLQIWLLLRVSSHQGCCSYSEMHMVDQRQRSQTCILKAIHYPHNENLHPTPHGRLGAECAWRMLRLEAVKERTELPNYPAWCFLVPAEEF